METLHLRLARLRSIPIVGMVPSAAGAGSNLQRLLERGLGRRRGESNGIGA